MFASAAFSFILYLLVFFKLRGNITVDGYKIHFQKRPKVRVGRTAAGTYIMTDDRRVESHLTTVAKQMLWYPIAYTVLVLPIACARFSTFTGSSVPFEVTIFTASVFMLTGFVNAVLFCLTRNVLPGTWRQRFGIGSAPESHGSKGAIASAISRANATWHGAVPTRAGTMGTVSTGTSHLTLSVGVEKAVEVTYDDVESRPSLVKEGFTPSPPSSPPAHGSIGQQTGSYDQHPQQRYLGARVHPTNRANTTEWEVIQHPAHAPSELESGMYRPAPGLEAHASSHPFATATDTQGDRPTSILIIGNPDHPPRVSSLESGGDNSGMHPMGPNQ